LLTGQQWSERTINEEIERRTNFELLIDQTLAEGGINKKAVHEITECSKTIKEQLEHRIT
jgi:hypothetical protein